MPVEHEGLGALAVGTGMGTELGQLLAVGSPLGPFHGLFINPKLQHFFFPAPFSCWAERVPGQGGAGKAFTVWPCRIIQRDFFPFLFLFLPSSNIEIRE